MISFNGVVNQFEERYKNGWTFQSNSSNEDEQFTKSLLILTINVSLIPFTWQNFHSNLCQHILQRICPLGKHQYWYYHHHFFSEMSFYRMVHSWWINDENHSFFLSEVREFTNSITATCEINSFINKNSTKSIDFTKKTTINMN